MKPNYQSLIVFIGIIVSASFSYAQQNNSNELNIKSTPVKAVTSSPASTPSPNSISSSQTRATNAPISYAVGKNGVQRVVKEEKQLTDYNTETIVEVEKLLKEFYGPYYNELGAPNRAEYAAFYERCEYISLSVIPVEYQNEIPNISTLAIKDKYNPTEVYNNTNEQGFELSNFNPFKYRINHYKENDLYFKIYNTNTVLKINGLK